LKHHKLSDVSDQWSEYFTRETLAQGGYPTTLTKPTALSSFPPGAPSVTQEGVPFMRRALLIR
jgi:hypothetical protein